MAKAKLLKQLSSYCIPRPGRQGLWLIDLLYALIIIALQLSLVPYLLSFTYLDLLTPWIAYAFIVLGTGRALLIALLAALALEQHGMVPAGLYLCSYWVVGTLIVLVRKHISWRNTLPWLATLGLAQLWIIFFEVLVYMVKQGSLAFFDVAFTLGMVLRLGGALVFALIFARKAPEHIGEEKAA